MQKVLIIANATDADTPFTRIHRAKYIALDHIRDSARHVLTAPQIPATPDTNAYEFELPNYYCPL